MLAGLPKSVPGYSIDRMCAGAMTAVTTLSPAIMAGAYDVALAGGVEHMGRHPMGEGVDPNPRFLAEKLVDPEALLMGKTAENLHDRFPHLTKERADAFALARQPKTAKAYAEGKIQPTWSRSRSASEAAAGAWPPGRAPAAETTHGGPGRAEDPVPPPRPGHRRQRGRSQRRRHRRHSGRRGLADELGLTKKMRLVVASPSPASSRR